MLAPEWLDRAPLATARTAFHFAMPLSVIGANYNSAPLPVRERLAVSRESLVGCVRELVTLPGMEESVLLSTCNRTEVFAIGSEHAAAGVEQWLAARAGMRREELAGWLVRMDEADAVRHAFRVAAGLDSMVLGEPQILGQLKDAYRAAAEAGGTGKVLNRLFQQAFAAAKRVRTETGIGANPVSVASAAVRLAEQVHGALAQCTALLVGAGETIELVATHLHGQGLRRLLVANRSMIRAQALAHRFAAPALALEDVPAQLAQCDVVVTATGAERPLLDAAAFRAALAERRRRPMYVVDLGVPRDVDPAVAELEDVYLFTVDDLREVVAHNRQARASAAAQAEELAELEVQRFVRWLHGSSIDPLMHELRTQAAAIRAEVLARARRRIAGGAPVDAVLEMATAQVLNKWLHAPSQRLREASGEEREQLAAALRTLMGLPRGDER